ncbi:MAG: hypothetical protein ACRDWI_06695 [Jiangellaceae bacterium]
METMDSHPGRDDAVPDAEPAPTVEPHWLSALLRADALAITSLVITAATVLGLPFLHDVFSLFLYNPQFINHAWQYVPGLVAAGVGMATGLLALRQAAAQHCAGWVKAAAAAPVLVCALVALGTTVAWLYAPDAAEIFGDITF